MVRFGFGFISLKPKKSNRNRSQTGKKPSQPRKTESNRFEPVFVLKNRTKPKSAGLNRFRFGFFFKFGLVTFFYKNRTESKMITYDIICILSYKLYCRSKKNLVYMTYTCTFLVDRLV